MALAGFEIHLFLVLQVLGGLSLWDIIKSTWTMSSRVRESLEINCVTPDIAFIKG